MAPGLLPYAFGITSENGVQQLPVFLVALFEPLPPALLHELMGAEPRIQLLITEPGEQRAIREICGADLREDAGEGRVAASLPQPAVELEILARAPVQVLVARMVAERVSQLFQVAPILGPEITPGQLQRIRFELQANIHDFPQPFDRKIGHERGGIGFLGDEAFVFQNLKSFANRSLAGSRCRGQTALHQPLARTQLPAEDRLAYVGHELRSHRDRLHTADQELLHKSITG